MTCQKVVLSGCRRSSMNIPFVSHWHAALLGMWIWIGECDWLCPDVWQILWASLTVLYQCKQKMACLQKKMSPKTLITLGIVEMKWTVSLGMLINKCLLKTEFHIACTNRVFIKEWVWRGFLILPNNIWGVLGGNIASMLLQLPTSDWMYDNVYEIAYTTCI